MNGPKSFLKRNHLHDTPKEIAQHPRFTAQPHPTTVNRQTSENFKMPPDMKGKQTKKHGHLRLQTSVCLTNALYTTTAMSWGHYKESYWKSDMLLLIKIIKSWRILAKSHTKEETGPDPEEWAWLFEAIEDLLCYMETCTFITFMK